MFAENRFFFALKPPRDVARRMALEAERRAPQGNRQSIDRMHSTIGILNDRPSVADDLVTALMDVGQRIAADPFPCLFDRVVGGRDIVTLRPSRRNGALVDLFHQIEAGIRDVGLTMREDYKYSPHVTLSYRSGGTPFNEMIQGHGWLVEDVVLIHSLLGQTEHRELARWPLLRGSGPQLSLF